MLSFPSSTSIMSAIEVIGLVIEAIQNMASFAIGVCVLRSLTPTVSRLFTPSLPTTSVTAPAIVWSSTKRCKAGATLCDRDSARAGSEAEPRVIKRAKHKREWERIIMG